MNRITICNEHYEILFSYVCSNNSIRLTLEHCAENNISLAGAYLMDSNLANAKLDGLDLRDATFISCDLSAASLVGVDLRNATFWGCNLRGADLRCADFTKTQISNCIMKETVKDGTIYSKNNRRFFELPRFDNKIVNIRRSLNLEGK